MFNINNGNKIFGNELITANDEFVDFMSAEWLEIKENVMTKAEAEAKFNIKIVG